jgi:oligo-1,6-glucosidase
VLTVGEMPLVNIPEAVLFTDPDRRELDMVFQFEHVWLDAGEHRYDLRPLPLPALKASLAAWQDGLAERGWNSLYWGNHDSPRSVSRFGDDGPYRVESAKAIATVLHLHRGTPYIYQGDELGMANAPFGSIADYRDIEVLNFYATALDKGDVDLDALLVAMGRRSRDHGRTPMQWDATPGAGFTTGEPWIAINPDNKTVNVAEQMNRPGSVLEHYRRLIALRHGDPVVTTGDFQLLVPEHPSVWAFLRRGAGASLLVAANWSAAPAEVALPLAPHWGTAAVVLTNLDGPSPELVPTLRLRPWESIVWHHLG